MSNEDSSDDERQYQRRGSRGRHNISDSSPEEGETDGSDEEEEAPDSGDEQVTKVNTCV